MIAFCDFIPQRQSKREYENFHVTVRSELTARSWRCWMPPNKGFQPTRLNRGDLAGQSGLCSYRLGAAISVCQ